MVTLQSVTKRLALNYASWFSCSPRLQMACWNPKKGEPKRQQHIYTHSPCPSQNTSTPLFGPLITRLVTSDMILNPLQQQQHRLPDVDGRIASDEPVPLAAVEDVVVLGEPVRYSRVSALMDKSVIRTRRVGRVSKSWAVATYIAYTSSSAFLSWSFPSRQKAKYVMITAGMNPHSCTARSKPLLSVVSIRNVPQFTFMTSLRMYSWRSCSSYGGTLKLACETLLDRLARRRRKSG